MSEQKVWRLNDAAQLRSYTNPRFKTMKISVNMLLPLTKETAAVYGIFPSLVTRATREYPGFTALNQSFLSCTGQRCNPACERWGISNA